MLTNRITWEPLRTIDATTLVAGIWTPVGTPLEFPSTKLKMVNNTSLLILVSIGMINSSAVVFPVDVLPPNSFWLYDETIIANTPFVQAGTQIYVNSIAGPATPSTPPTPNPSIYLVSQYIIHN